MTRLRQHPDLTVVLILLLLAVGLMLPYLVQTDALLWPRSDLGTDFMHYRWTSTDYIRRSLQDDGQFPLWYGDVMGGLPMVGNLAVTMVFYPPYLLIVLLPVPIAWGFALLAAFHYWLAGLGGYALARQALGLHRWAAFIGALAVMFMPRLGSNLVGDIGLTYAMSWAPLALTWMWLALERRSLPYAILAGMALAFQFLLHVQIFFFTAWIMGLYLVYCIAADLIQRKKPLPIRTWAIYAGWLALIALVCIGLAAYNLLPFISYTPYISRDSMTLNEANHYALPPGGILFSILPISLKFPEWEAYFGLLALMLAPLAFLHPRRRTAVFWLLIVLFSVLFSLGKLTPLFAALFYLVPGFNRLRVPPRMWYFASLGVAMLMSLGIDALITNPTVELSRRMRIWLYRVSALFIFITIAGRFFTRRSADWLLGFTASLGLILGLWAVHRWNQGRLSLTRFGVFLTLGLALDLIPLCAAFMTPRAAEKELRLPAVAAPLIDPQIQAQKPFRLYSVRHEVDDPVIVKNHLQIVDGMNSFQFEPYVQLLTVASGCPLKGFAGTLPACSSNEISKTAYRDTIPNPAVLGLLNVRYVISPQPITGNEWTLLNTDEDERLYENQAVLPRVFAVGRVETVSEDDIWQTLAETDVQHTALVEEGKTLDNDFYAPAEIVKYSANEIRVHVDLPADGLLVVSEVWISGWQADDNGHSRDVVPVDGALRGVYLSAGAHDVTLRFRPPAFIVGSIISGITLLVCLVILLRSLRLTHQM